MRRKLFTLAAAVSAVLCTAACVAWPAGYWRTVELGRHVEEPNAMGVRYLSHSLRVEAGRLDLEVEDVSLSLADADDLANSLPSDAVDW